MKKKALSLALALVMCLGLLPVTASAAEKLPDWYFLFAIFKNVDADCVNNKGENQHIKYSMTQEEIDFARNIAANFEAYMNEVGVMRAHVDVVEIDKTVKKLKNDYSGGSWLSTQEAEPLLTDKVDLDKYDHVSCIINLNDLSASYVGLTGGTFQNGTGYSCINLKHRDLSPVGLSFPSSAYVHEFLHFMFQLCDKWGVTFDLHKAGDLYNADKIDKWKGYYTDVILNRAKGEYGTGVLPVVWKYPPHVLRTMSEFTIPSGVTSLGDRAFWGYTALTSVHIPASVTNIGYATFWDTSIKDVYYSGTKSQWKAIKIGKYNEALTKANIHYNSGAGTQPTTPTAPTITVEKIPASGTAIASTQTVTVDGKAVEFQMYALKDANGNLTNYIKLRDMAYVLNGTKAQFAVGYDGKISLTTGKAYEAGGTEMTTPYSGDRAYKGGAQTLKIDGKDVAMTAITLTDDNGGGYNYFKLRDLGKALGFNVSWNNGVIVESDKPYTE